MNFCCKFFISKCAKTLGISVVLSMALFFSCGPGTSGSEVGNGFTLSGCIVDTCGKRVANVEVTLYGSEYTPVNHDTSVYRDTTDESGVYVFPECRNGKYSIQGVQRVSRLRSLTSDIDVHDGNIVVADDTIQKPGKINIVFSENSGALDGYIAIPGTSISKYVKQSTVQPVLLDSIPAGIINSIQYISSGNLLSTTIARNVFVKAGGTVDIVGDGWSYSKRIYLNTSATGANITNRVVHFPLLVRLDKTNFNFTQCKGDASDLRFRSMNGKLLDFEIERYDSASSTAELWVSVDTIYGNNSSQFIYLLWGNSSVSGLADEKRVFNTDYGYQGVWHLGETPAFGMPSFFDRTKNNLKGIARNNLSTENQVEGAIGNAIVLNGAQATGGDWIRIDSSNNLDFKGSMTLSAWIKLGFPLSNNVQCIFSKLKQKQVVNTNEFDFLGYAFSYSADTGVLFNAYTDSIFWNYQCGTINDNQWHNVTICVDSVTFNSYIDGEKECSDKNNSMDIFPSGGSAAIGRFASNVDGRYFNGAIDEVRVMSTTLSADFIRLSYINQSQNDLLVQYR